MGRALVLGVLMLAVLGASSAWAGQPSIERVVVDDTFADGFLTAACGVPVTTHAEGHVILREFSGAGPGLLSVNTLNIALTATAGDNTFRFRDVGADLTQVKKDGTTILMIIGQIPFDFFGVLKIDLATGEATHEPNANAAAKQLSRACAALTS